MPAANSMNSWSGIGVGVAGLGIGWLVGLSTSPVVAAVIATLLAAVAALATGQPADGGKLPLRVSPAPLVALVVGIAIGATFGMKYRVGELFSNPATPVKQESLEETVQRWVTLGANKKEVVQRLLDRELPARNSATSNEESEKAVPHGLVEAEGFADTCVELKGTEAASILSAMAASNNPELRLLANEAIRIKASAAFAEKLRSVVCPAF